MKPDVREGLLKVQRDGIEENYLINFGHLNPIDTVDGIQQRLHNLGYDCGPVDGIRGPITTAAIKAFQKKHNLKVDGIIGPVTRGKFVEMHGS